MTLQRVTISTRRIPYAQSPAKPHRGRDRRGSGIGRAIALGYAREGASVAVLDINAEGAAKTAADIKAEGHKAINLTLDVTDAKACRTVASEVAAKLGPISILVNNAGITRRNALTADARRRGQGLAGHHDDQSQWRVQRDAGVSRTAAQVQGADRQPRLDPVLRAHPYAEFGRLHRLQARRARLHQGARRRARQGRRARQRHRPRLHRDAAECEHSRQPS